MNYNGMRYAWWLILLVTASILCGSFVSVCVSGIDEYVATCVAQSFMIIPMVLGLVCLKRVHPYAPLKELLGFNGFNPPLMLLLLVMPGAASAFAGIIQLPFTEALVKMFGEQGTFSCPETVESFLWLFLSLCVLAPVLEEIIFRGIIMRFLAPYGTLISIIVSAVGFSMLHFAPSIFIAILIIGIVLGFVRVYTNSILSCILFHSVFNFSSLLQIVFEKELEGMWLISGIYILVMACLFPVLFFILYKTSEHKGHEKGYVRWGGNGLVPIVLMVIIYAVAALWTAIML